MLTHAPAIELVSPFRERIEPLLAKPELGEIIFPEFNGGLDGSNCHGTSLFVFDAENLVSYGRELVRGVESGHEQDCFFLPRDRSRPGFVSKGLM